MSHKFFLIVTLSLLSMGMSPQRASADTPLTRATVQALRNQVQLIFKNRVARAARNADTMTPGDSLATARQSFAELRFNDSSLARIGERALFQFVPNTRNFYLGNGTALLLIPPGQGRTNVRTPNAAAGIRGSALFVRYNEDTNTTIVGALTNSRIEVSNGDSPQAQTLKAGQMAVIIQNQIVQIYNFDLNTFYQTSELVKDLDLPLSNSTPNADPGIAAVQAETSQAAREQSPLTGQVSENPTFVSLAPPPGVQAAVTPNPLGTATPIPSGFDRGTARQTILPNTSPDTSQPSPPNPRPVTPGGPTLPNPENTTAPPPTLTPPPAVAIPPTTSTPPSTIPPLQPQPPVPPSSSPAPPTNPSVTPPVTPAPVTPAPVRPAPTSGITVPVQPAIPVTPAPVTPAPTTSPSITAPVQPSIPVTPAPVTPAPTPGITAPVQPAIPVTPAPVTPAPAPAPAISPSVTAPPVTPAPVTAAPVTPAPVTPAPTLSITTPAPRPAPVVTPTVLTPAPASSVQPTTTTNSAVGTSGLQTTTVTTPVIVTPALTVPGQ